MQNGVDERGPEVVGGGAADKGEPSAKVTKTRRLDDLGLADACCKFADGGLHAVLEKRGAWLTAASSLDWRVGIVGGGGVFRGLRHRESRIM